MRKLNSFLLGLVLIIASLAVLLLAMEKKNSSSSKANSLVVYNWGDYIDPSLINKFQKETGISVQYETFDSNEAMYTKIEQGGTRYDIAIPSDYMIDKMRREDLLVKLDKSQIKGLDNLGSQFMGKSFDPKNDYSIPYFWGTVGIVYNDTMIKNPPQHWTDLWNSDYKDSIMLVDGAR
ncbi:ABC transporter substrate-binding protein, partial [Streptococcus sobrinus]